MALVEFDSNAVVILSRLIKREELESAGDAIRFLDNGYTLQKAVIHQQENEITKREAEIERLKGIMATAGIV